MKRAEALKHFEEEYSMPAFINMDDDMDKYIEENRKDLTDAFIDNFRTLCNKIKAMQEEGKKDKIAYITYSFDIENLQRESREYVVQAYGTEWFYEEGEECRITYDVDWIYKFLDSTYEKLFEISKKYVGKINSADMNNIWKDGIKYCDVRLLNFSKKAIREAIKIEEFMAIRKEEVLEIRLGEYKGYNEIIHKIDTRAKDSAEIKEWLEGGEKSYSYSILQNLNLSGGNYKDITCHNSDFSGSDLSNSSFEGASLIESVFVKSILNKTNFKKAKLAESSFYNTTIKNSNFEKARLRKSDFQNSNIIGCNLSDTGCNHVNFYNCSFKDCILTMTDFSFSNLENANLSGNDLKNAVFIESNLRGADLSDSDLTGAEFVGIDFTQFKFDNATFGNNEIIEIKIFAKDIEKLNLSEEQRKELTIVG